MFSYGATDPFPSFALFYSTFLAYYLRLNMTCTTLNRHIIGQKETRQPHGFILYVLVGYSPCGCKAL